MFKKLKKKGEGRGSNKMGKKKKVSDGRIRKTGLKDSDSETDISRSRPKLEYDSLN